MKKHLISFVLINTLFFVSCTSTDTPQNNTQTEVSHTEKQQVVSDVGFYLKSFYSSDVSKARQLTHPRIVTASGGYSQSYLNRELSEMKNAMNSVRLEYFRPSLGKPRFVQANSKQFVIVPYSVIGIPQDAPYGFKMINFALGEKISASWKFHTTWKMNDICVPGDNLLDYYEGFPKNHRLPKQRIQQATETEIRRKMNLLKVQ